MPRFLIRQEDPFKYKGEIAEFWRKDLPDTPEGRLEWMMNGNPAGPATWFFAFDAKNGELSGMISVMPRDLLVNGQKMRAGIMGDLVVAEPYRVFGPALSLVKAVTNSLASLGLDFIYTIPNRESEKLIERAGFTELGQFVHLVRPVNLRYYLNKYTNGLFKHLPETIGRVVLKTISLQTYVLSGNVREEPSITRDIEALLESEEDKRPVTSLRTFEFLDWRYAKNPFGRFRIITCWDRRGSKLLGYLIFVIGGAQLSIYDTFLKSNVSFLRLVRKAERIASGNQCKGLYVRLLDSNPMQPLFRKCGFLDTKDRAPIMVYTEKPIDLKGWDFFSGDRNI